jgi:ABC-type transporter Mla subunit MlaD
MADGIRRSIEQVLLDSVAPSIQQASSALGALASELVNRQERGMQELAVRFASALSSEIASNLQPVNREITQMGSLMADVRNYIEYAMHALETVRQQAGGLLSDTSGALREMSAARIQLVDDFSQVDKRLQQLVASTSEMAAIYRGNDQNLGSIVEHVSRQMGEYSQNLGLINGEAIRAMQEAKETAYIQNDSAGQYLSAMQNQVNQLTTQLSTDIRELLDEIHSEASGIATQTEIIGSQLGSLNASLENSLTNFTQESTRYVRQTLASLDGSMAELASRIAGTAAELRDAVDALPQSLRQAVTTPDPGSQRV